MSSFSVRRVAPVLAAACLAVLSACAGEPASDAGGEPDLGRIPAMLETENIEFPLSGYASTAAERQKLRRAQDALVARCMSRFGFSYSAPRRPAPPATGNRYVFGVVDSNEVAQYGYRNPQSLDGDRERPVRPALSGAERLVLSGADDVDPQSLPTNQEAARREGGSDEKVNGRTVPVGGCTREAFLKLYAPKSNAVDIMYVFNLRSEAESRTRADSRVRRNDTKWSACMEKAGYSVSDPMDAAAELGFRSNEELSSPAAVAAAGADVACKKKVNLVGVRFAVTTAYQERLIDRNAETLALARRQHEQRLERAAELLS
ncbi:hypothetical protein [Streptomyces sp. TR06-5]|uniref:hypothetical protein n=1 Tax=unclassified Streptomyces TaxID=2593676 RepID=UPI0039A2458B